MFDGVVREKFLEKLQDYAVFCGIDVNAFSILPDSLRLLIHVRPPEKLSDDELLSRLGAIYHPLTVDEVRKELEAARASGANDIALAIRGRYLRRMWDVSNFMKEYLAWVSQWMNREKGRTGTLFEDRFRSVVVENCPAVLSMLAAYVELAPVRAGLVDRPEKWRWSAGGAAALGNRFALAAVQRLTGDRKGERNSLILKYSSWINKIANQSAEAPMHRPHNSTSETLECLSGMLFSEVVYFTHGKAIGNWNFYGKLKTGEGEPIDWAEWVPMEGAHFNGCYAAKSLMFGVRPQN